MDGQTSAARADDVGVEISDGSPLQAEIERLAMVCQDLDDAAASLCRTLTPVLVPINEGRADGPLAVVARPDMSPMQQQLAAIRTSVSATADMLRDAIRRVEL